MKTLLFAGATVAALTTANLAPAIAQATQPVSQVVQWNRMLLVIVRTPGAQPATIHATRSFAIMHAAIYDAVNAIEETHKPYLVRLSVRRGRGGRGGPRGAGKAISELPAAARHPISAGAGATPHHREG